MPLRSAPNRKSVSLFFGLLLASSAAQARVFDFNKETLASYFRGTAAQSNLKKTAFEKAGGQDLTFSDQPSYNYSGEFGVLFKISNVNVRLGAEIFRPNAITGIEAKDASEAVLYTIDSGIISYGGVLSMDFPLVKGDRSRIFLSLGGGYFNTTLKNDFRFTSAGTSAYGVGDYVEEASAASYMGQASFGYEFLLSDSVTCVFDAGYRNMLINGLKHSRTATTLIGAVNPGQPMQNYDGADRVLDLSGIWAGLSLRFYIGL
jgi:hypothetical protein